MSLTITYLTVGIAILVAVWAWFAGQVHRRRVRRRIVEAEAFSEDE